LHEELEKACRVVEPLGGSIEFKVRLGPSPTVNSPEATAVAVAAFNDLLGNENIKVVEQRMGGEDFSFMTQVAPACFTWLGVHDPAWGDKIYNLHRADFRIDEDALPVGTAALAAAALNWMKEMRAVVRLQASDASQSSKTGT
jgi:amidohydrolase